MSNAHRNRLADATSPYLQQHADNPVDWWPWCDEALELARDSGRPILLSIGYSACHWCHVMAHESFEDDATAALMNRLFVNIKVDREERPDLDRIYQTAHQLLSQRSGGWPLTVFLAPDDHTPFFAGTYFPPEPRHRLPSFRQLLDSVATAWQDQQAAIREQNTALMDALARMAPATPADGVLLNATPLTEARRQFVEHYDPAHGGFGNAPKFPQPSNLAFLLRHGHDSGDEHATGMALHTLRRMARGGMNDLIGGGFCRYSVDARWMIPHFEKMLYDNGQLLALYADAWAASGEDLFRTACEQTAAWLLREMQSPDGGFYSSLDADSEGEEGKYYVWTPAQVAELLNEAEYDLIAPLFGLDRAANFEGHWHLHGYRTLESVAEELGIDIAEAEARLDSARDKLLAARGQRIRPGRDEKILTSWNGLAIHGLARAGRLLGRPDWLAAATRAVDFVHSHMWREGRLLATCKDGTAALPAYLDDHAYLVDALLELLQARWRRQDLDFALDLADLMLSRFQDHDNGGFYFTADDHERLIQRPKTLSDDAMPAGTGVAAGALQRLAHLIGEPAYTEAAERTLRNAWPQIQTMPWAHPGLLMALAETLTPPETVILRADERALSQRLVDGTRHFEPHRSIYGIPVDTPDLPGLLRERSAEPGPVAYICQGNTCRAPVRDAAGLAALGIAGGVE